MKTIEEEEMKGTGRALTTITRERTLVEKEDPHNANIPAWLIKALSPRKTFKMLVPLDGSEFAEDALKHLSSLDEKFGGQSSDIILLRVIEPFAPPFRYPPRMPMDFKEYLDYEKRCAADICSRYLAKMQKRLEKVHLNSRFIVREGIPADAISEYARKNEVDLIVMSTHGRTGLNRWVFGNTAEKVIHSCTCPVFTVRSLNKKSIVLHVNIL